VPADGAIPGMAVDPVVHLAEVDFGLQAANLTTQSGAAEFLYLESPEDWQQLYDQFKPRNPAVGAPWRRCMVLLQGHIARTCVIERHYVCLDHRSEVSAFYSQLDEQVHHSSTRLHFFSNLDDSIDPVEFMVEPSLDPADRARRFVRELDSTLKDLMKSIAVESSVALQQDATRIASSLRLLVDVLVENFVKPYIESGFPIYCHTQNHAMVLCGLSKSESDGTQYIFHDDVFGPYLFTSSVALAHREDFDAQSATILGDQGNIVPGADRLNMISDRHTGTSRYVESIVVPTPRRVLLTPSSAIRASGIVVDSANISMTELLADSGLHPEDDAGRRGSRVRGEVDEGMAQNA
jgi:hypothetical protein